MYVRHICCKNPKNDIAAVLPKKTVIAKKMYELARTKCLAVLFETYSSHLGRSLT